MSEDALDLDAVRDLCRDPRRCIVLAVLAEQERRLTVNDLTKAVVRHERDAPITEVDPAAVADVRDELVEQQIPTLQAAEVVAFDAERQLVAPTEEIDRLRSHLLEVVDEESELELPVEL